MPKSAVIDAIQTLQYQLTQLAMQRGQLASLNGGLEVIEKDTEKAVQTFISDNAQKLQMRPERQEKVEDLDRSLRRPTP